jgi:hypothetical protein
MPRKKWTGEEKKQKKSKGQILCKLNGEQKKWLVIENGQSRDMKREKGFTDL